MARKKRVIERKKREGITKKDSVNKIIAQQRKIDILHMILDGKTSKEIRDYLCTKYNIKPVVASQYLSQANKEVKKYRDRQVDNVISIHIQRYEQIYTNLYNINAYSVAMTALKYKEKLLGMHKQDFRLQVNNMDATTIIGGSQGNQTMGYDPSSLNKKKRLRLEILMDKCKK